MKKRNLGEWDRSRRQHILNQAEEYGRLFVLCDARSVPGGDWGIDTPSLNEAVRKGTVKVKDIVKAFREALEEHFSSC